MGVLDRYCAASREHSRVATASSRSGERLEMLKSDCRDAGISMSARAAWQVLKRGSAEAMHELIGRMGGDAMARVEDSAIQPQRSNTSRLLAMLAAAGFRFVESVRCKKYSDYFQQSISRACKEH